MRGINLGNAFDVAAGEAPPLRLTDGHVVDRYLDAIAGAGFDTVRVPVRWPAHLGDEAALERIDRVVAGSLGRGLTVIVDQHHVHELMADPGRHEGAFLDRWRQIARRYAGQPAGLHLELLNEPRGRLTAGVWNRLLRSAHAAVRAVDPERTIIVGPARMYDVDALADLELPADDRLVVTVHYYAPMPFTHQGADWVDGSSAWLGTEWGSTVDEQAVRADLTRAAGWARDRGCPMFVGEFGAYERAHPDARARWTRCVRGIAEELGLGWCYWDFGTDFGAYDPARDEWREALLRALIAG